MKLLTVFLSLILLVLSCLPCADSDNEIKFDLDGKFIVENHSDHANDTHTDLCSPFCICNCCGAQILSFTPSIIFNITGITTEYITKIDITYKSHLASMFSGSIWQPPQIV